MSDGKWSAPFRVACDKHNEHMPVYTDGRPLMDDACPWCRMEAAEGWRREAERWEREVNEFDHPIQPDHDYHEVRDFLNDAFVAGVTECIRRIDGGRFLHDEAPDRRFANEVIAMLKREFLPQEPAPEKESA